MAKSFVLPRLLVATAVLAGVTGTTLAQDSNPTHPPPPNRGAVKLEMVPSLIVMNALGAGLQGQVLTLTGIAPTAITFADRLTFDVRVLEGDLTGADGPAAVFIDIIGMPFTPLSYAGVARRTARRAYWYGAATAPYYRPPPPPYGYPAYPPPYYPHPYYPPPY